MLSTTEFYITKLCLLLFYFDRNKIIPFVSQIIPLKLDSLKNVMLRKCNVSVGVTSCHVHMWTNVLISVASYLTSQVI